MHPLSVPIVCCVEKRLFPRHVQSSETERERGKATTSKTDKWRQEGGFFSSLYWRRPTLFPQLINKTVENLFLYRPGEKESRPRVAIALDTSAKRIGCRISSAEDLPLIMIKAKGIYLSVECS